jgi:uncharacterized protein (DUF2237 family)
MTGRRRVAITGIGLVTPVGNDVATTWAALLAGASGGREISLFDASGFPVRIAAEVKDFDDSAIGDRKLESSDRPIDSHWPQRIGICDAGIADRGHRDALGLCRRRGMMTSEFVDLARRTPQRRPRAHAARCSPMPPPTIRWCSAAARRRRHRC